MAFLTPENIPSRSGVPDRLRQVARALRDFMPYETTVWLAEKEGGAPYLEVLDPAAGIVVIEAPPIRVGGRRRRRPWRAFSEQDMVRIRDDMAERAEDLRKRIDRALVRSLPVRCVLAAPDHDEVPVSALDSVQGDLPLLTRSDMTGSRLRPAIGRILGSLTMTPLTEQEENRARAVINPEIVLGATEGYETLPLFQDPDIAPGDIIRVMDREQERVAEHLGWGYRMLRGVAGSGKTLVLTHRVRHLHRLFPNWRILLLCYNRLLANALQMMVDESDRVDVTNIDRLAYRLAGQESGRGRPDFEELRKRAAVKAGRLPDSRRYDVVLVDEAQDFGRQGLELAYAMLKPSRRDLGAAGRNLRSYRAGHFVMALDSAQNVYRRSMTWNPPGLTARGRTTVFRRNYRNTREILELAWTFLEGSPDRSPPVSDGGDSKDRIEPEAAPRSGPVPRLLDCRDLRGEAEAIAAEIGRLTTDGVDVGDIAVMYGHRELETELQKAFRQRRLPYFHIQYQDRRGRRPNRDIAMGVRDKVRVSTLQGLKGLEFSRVFIGGVNQAYVHDVAEEDQPVAVKQLLYVAMTRAMDRLVITISGDGESGRALRNAQSG